MFDVRVSFFRSVRRWKFDVRCSRFPLRSDLLCVPLRPSRLCGKHLAVTPESLEDLPQRRRGRRGTQSGTGCSRRHNTQDKIRKCSASTSAPLLRLGSCRLESSSRLCGKHLAVTPESLEDLPQSRRGRRGSQRRMGYLESLKSISCCR